MRHETGDLVGECAGIGSLPAAFLQYGFGCPCGQPAAMESAPRAKGPDSPGWHALRRPPDDPVSGAGGRVLTVGHLWNFGKVIFGQWVMRDHSAVSPVKRAVAFLQHFPAKPLRAGLRAVVSVDWPGTIGHGHPATKGGTPVAPPFLGSHGVKPTKTRQAARGEYRVPKAGRSAGKTNKP